MDVPRSAVLGPPTGPGRPELSPRNRRLVAGAAAGAGVLVLGSQAADWHATTILLGVTALLLLIAGRDTLLSWPVLLGSVIAVILFIPIRRYTIAGGGPVSLEPYRVLIAVVLSLWFAAVLVDPAARVRSTGLEGPLLLFCAAILISLGLNVRSINAQGISSDVFKTLSFFASFFLIMYFAASAITTRELLDKTIKGLVAGSTLISISSIVEWRTGLNVFNHIDRVLPALHIVPLPEGDALVRGGRVRAFGSAQHPIALGALLVMMLPFAMYLFRRSGNVWWLVSAAILTLGALATGSRTGALMLAVLLVVFFWLKRTETIRMLPMLLPLILVCQIVMPGTLGTFRAVIFPQGSSLISEQAGGAGDGTGRVADLGPSLDEWGQRPVFGQGFGTRLPSNEDKVTNAPILDDEWLSILLEVGAVGFFALLWLYVRGVRRLAKAAKPDATDYGWLLTAFAAATTSFAIGMVTYDAFSFTQVTFISFMLLGLGETALRLAPGKAPPPPVRLEAVRSNLRDIGATISAGRVVPRER